MDLLRAVRLSLSGHNHNLARSAFSPLQAFLIFRCSVVPDFTNGNLKSGWSLVKKLRNRTADSGCKAFVLNAIPASVLVSETSAHGDAFASFGTTAREDGLSTLGLHPRTEAVGLRAATAVRLKRTFGHETGALLLGNDCYEQTVSIRESRDLGKKA